MKTWESCVLAVRWKEYDKDIRSMVEVDRCKEQLLVVCDFFFLLVSYALELFYFICLLAST